MPWGRGGAGNIAFDGQAKQQNEHKAQDLEAQHSSASSIAPPLKSTPSEYAHMGRGGAGNWYQPAELEKEGKFNQSGDATAAPTSSKPQISEPWHPENQHLPVARAGRGGAGNFVWKDEEKEKKKEAEEERKKGEVGQSVERDVEAGLAKPGAALLGGVKAGRGW